VTKPVPNAVRGRPPTLGADASLRIRLPSVLLVEMRKAAKAARQTDAAFVRAAIEAKIRG
jgi:predicted DNA-binding protein